MNPINDVAPAFVEMAHRIVWAVVATADTSGRPMSRVLHPIWEWDGTRLTGWILTSPRSPKAKDLAENPRVSLTYWAPDHDTCTADADVVWETSDEEKAAGWARFASAPEPVGYDPSIVPVWTSPAVPEFGVLRLVPNRLRVMPGSVMTRGVGGVLLWSRSS